MKYLNSGASFRSRQRGQSLVVAIVVMFALLFIGSIFVGLVARNLTNSGRGKDSVAAEELARAGIDYCNRFLMNSPEAADWRPAPTKLINAQDPDSFWLRDGTWTRVDLGRGRALVRVTYQPDYIGKILNPLSKTIKIESVGRVGLIDPNDPTTFLNSPAPRLRRELVAYKALGLTDYLIFDTNRYKESKFKAHIGIPPVSVPKPAGYSGVTYPLALGLGGNKTRLLEPVTGPNFRFPGAPIRVNGSLQLIGSTTLFLDPNNSEGLFVAGPITADQSRTDVPFKPGEIAHNPQIINGITNAITFLLDTSDPNYTTAGGLARDDSANPDQNGYARSVSVLDPPLLDVLDESTGQNRYRSLTRDSGRIVGGLNTGLYALGAGLYIDNYNSIDQQSRAVQNGQTLRNIWLTPGANASWVGPYFIPKGAFIDFGYPVVQSRDPFTSNLIANQYAATPGFSVYRDGSDRFRSIAGSNGPQTLYFSYFIYKPLNLRPVIKLENEFERSALRAAPFNMSEKDIDKFLPPFNGVVYAEGNVRVRGLLATKANIPIRWESSGESGSITDTRIRELVNPPAISVVSGSNIYVEGSIVREAADSMIALLATENVVVNTTMFMSLSNTSTAAWLPDQNDNSYPTHASVGGSDVLALDYLHGDDPTLYVDGSNNPIGSQLLVRNGIDKQGSVAFMNLFINDWASRAANSPVFPFNRGGGYLVGTEVLDSNVRPMTNGFSHDVYSLRGKPAGGSYVFTGDAGYTYPQGLRNSLRFGLDPSSPAPSQSGSQDYRFGGAAVVPMDVRIEAVIYAQNGSFFIMPGRPFNDDPADTREAALARAASLGMAAGTMLRQPGYTDMYPFFGDPIDCRITILGAISENRPASIADQSAWMQQWGFIPEVYGSTGASSNPPNPANELLIPTAHLKIDEVGGNAADSREQAEKDARITRSLRYMYDPALNTPYRGYDPNRQAFRTDDAYYDQTNLNNIKNPGRVLPPVPRLPVCPGYVYYGDPR